jgi:hypothetical protein
MVDDKPVLNCKFRDYLNPDDAKKEPQPTKPKDFNYGNKLNLQEQKQ